ncbi:uncharacterized protein LOC115236046 [Formica exsecta]|uniref:uncharacterized protein LOC115236046 n=1 Tax=Formica exsecta TaxID=72781 RepID=UPI0011447265|nr:uncharacterized protein LOC115236046 [Formica exsecta]
MLSFEPGEDQSQKVLGLRWHSHSDSFGFQVNPLSGNCTKRSILSELARIFDPFGFLAPLTFTAKRLIQLLWTLKLDWDDDPPADVCHRWECYQSEFGALAPLRLCRSLAAANVIRRELHGFCDASEQGYGAVVYLRIVTRNEVIIWLLSAKSKVAPLRSITLPRLELCAALLLSSLIVYIKQALRGRLSLDAEHAWSDTMVALSWIRSSPHRWKIFVRNRVASIQKNVVISSWDHVDTESNPADCCSRGLSSRELMDHSMWWHGPDWLLKFEPRAEPAYSLDNLPEEEKKVVTLISLDSPNMADALVDRFSSLDKICRVVAYCLRFIDQARIRSVPDTLAIDQIELHSALLVLVIRTISVFWRGN